MYVVIEPLALSAANILPSAGIGMTRGLPFTLLGKSKTFTLLDGYDMR